MRQILILSAILLQVSILAQPYCIHYTSKDGLPNENINALAEDAKGFIYVGCASGVYLFDGVDFNPIGKQGKGDLPNEAFITELIVDSLNNLWVATERNGLYHWESTLNKWTQYTNHPSNSDRPFEEIFDIELSNETLLIAPKSGGINAIDIGSLTFESNIFDVANNYRHISTTAENDLLLTRRNKIIRIDSGLNLNSIEIALESSTDLDLISTIQTANKDIFTVSYTKGLFSIQNGRAIPRNPPQTNDTWRYTIFDERKGELMIALRNVGLGFFDTENYTWHIDRPEPFNLNGLIKGKFQNGLLSKNGSIWLATSKGLSLIHPQLQGFQNQTTKTEVNEFLLDVQYHELTNQFVFAYASNADKVKVLDEKLNVKSTFNHTPNQKGIRSIFQLLPYQDHYFGLGNYLMEIDPISGRTTRTSLPYLSNLSNPNTACVDKNKLWLVHGFKNIIHYDLKAKTKIKEFELPLLSKPNGPQYIILDIADQGEYIAVAAHSAFFIINKKTYEIHSYDVDLNQKQIHKITDHPPSNGSIHQVQWYDNHLYISTKNEGLYKCLLNHKTKDIQILKSYAPSKIYSPVEFAWDDQKNMWIATDNGITVLDNNFEFVKKIGSMQGLAKTKLTQGISFSNGRIFLNGENGFITGDPKILLQKYTIPKVNINQIFVNGNAFDDDHMDQSMPYHQNDLTIHTSLPIYGIKNDYQYLYRLSPQNNSWIKSDLSANTFRYDNLSPGKYTFQIKAAANGDEGDVSSFQFTIKPPFWKTGWFVVMIILTFFLLTYLVYRYRLQENLKREKLKTQIAELQNEAIRAQLNPHFIFNALNSIRSLVLLDKKEESLNYLGNFSHLVREILNISKESSIPLSRELDFIKRYVDIERLRFVQDLEFTVSVDNNIDQQNVKVPPMILQPFVENAIWHGLIGKEGKARLKIEANIQDSKLCIIVDDNGKGRAFSIKNKTDKISTRKGFGELLSKKRIANLGENAQIDFIDKDKNGQPTGTTVIIRLPIHGTQN